MKKTELKEIKRFVIILFVIFLAVMQVDFFIKSISMLIGVLSPLLIGIVIAFLLNRVMMFYEKGIDKLSNKAPKKLKRIIAIVLSYISFLLVLAIIINIIVPELIFSIERLASNFNNYINNLESITDDILIRFGLEKQFDFLEEFFGFDWSDLTNIFSNIFNVFSQQLSSIIPSIFSFTTNVISNIVTFFIAVFISLYLLVDKERIFTVLQKMVLYYTSERFYKKTEYVGKIVVSIFNRYVVGQILDAAILGTLIGIAMTIVGLDYALLVGVLIAVTALVPILGAFLGGGISFFLLLLISPWDAMLFLILLLVIQQIDNNFIYPNVVGSSVGLPPLLVLLSITIGGSLFGLIGMLVAVPVASIIYTLIKNDLEEKERQRQQRPLEVDEIKTPVDTYEVITTDVIVKKAPTQTPKSKKKKKQRKKK